MLHVSLWTFLDSSPKSWVGCEQVPGCSHLKWKPNSWVFVSSCPSHQGNSWRHHRIHLLSYTTLPPMSSRKSQDFPHSTEIFQRQIFGQKYLYLYEKLCRWSNLTWSSESELILMSFQPAKWKWNLHKKHNPRMRKFIGDMPTIK